MEFKIESNSLEDTINLAQKLMEHKFVNMILCLDGDLGSGKTILTKGIAKYLNIDETITSPTFTIIKEYEDGIMPLYHMDVYRLEGNTDGIGIEEYYTRNGIVVIEWANSIKDILPDERIDIIFKVIDQNKRIITLVPYGEKYKKLCEAIK